MGGNAAAVTRVWQIRMPSFCNPLMQTSPLLAAFRLLIRVVIVVAALAWVAVGRVLAQAELPIAGLATVFADDLSQWDIYDYDNNRAGELRLRYPGIAGRGGDITQWSFRFDDIDGLVRPKITGRGDVWEVRVGDEVAIVRTLFANAYDQWSITSGEQRIVYVVRDYRLLEYWATRGPGGPGPFAVYTTYEGDWRDWTVADQSETPVSAAVQLAMIWLPIYMRLTSV